eukprot:m.14963 g.14963  ORF g.14963 m.14963 type:complete len:161 (+) comp7791_c0_seq2:55-537(+)
MPLLSEILFRSHDTDGSGTIDASELQAICYRLGYPMTREEIDASLRVIDKDASGQISYPEFKAWWAQKDRFQALKDERETQEDADEWAQWLESVTNHFNFFDKDRSGSIDRHEFKGLYENLKASYHVGTLEDALHELDENKDGVISLQEYIKWLRAQHNA